MANANTKKSAPHPLTRAEMVDVARIEVERTARLVADTNGRSALYVIALKARLKELDDLRALGPEPHRCGGRPPKVTTSAVDTRPIAALTP